MPHAMIGPQCQTIDLRKVRLVKGSLRLSKTPQRQGGSCRPPSQFLEQRKQVRFQQRHNQGLRQLFLTLSWNLRVYRITPDSGGN